MRILRSIIIFIYICTILFSRYQIFGEKVLKVYFLDVGQGDAIYISTPDGLDVLIDSGPDGTILSRLGEVMDPSDRFIDYLILSHPDKDHLGGLIDVFERYETSKVIFNDVDHSSLLYKNFKEFVGGNSQSIYAGDVLKIGCCVSYTIYWPNEKDLQSLDSNSSSIVGILTYHEFQMFLGGDIEESGEREISSKVSDVNVAKASHHGSRTSSSRDFLKALKPELIIIQSGKDNSYGHPHKEITDRYDELGIEYLLTVDLGNILVKSDGINYFVYDH